MVNLLIISANPKAKFVQDALQPQLKARIDVVADFDHGLKDVFEKRPAIVIIQDKIASITGESVARHIQLLLGSGAPTFIVMHEGNAKIRPIKGLFEYVVDLTQTEADLIGNLVNVLKRIIGSGWDKVAIPRQAVVGSPRSAIVMPEEERDTAGRPPADLLGDPGESEVFVAATGSADPANGILPKDVASAEDTVTMPVSAANDSRTLQSDFNDLSSLPVSPMQPAELEKTVAAAGVPSRQPSGREIPATAAAPAAGTDAVDETFDFPELDQPPSPTIPMAPEPAIPKAPEPARTVPEPHPAPESPRKIAARVPDKPASPADFRIATPAAPERVPQAEDILTAFDDNFRSHSRFRFVPALVVLAVLIAGWYLLQQAGIPLPFFQKPKQPAPAPAAAQPAAVRKTEPVSAVQKPVSTRLAPVAAATPPLPAFVPLAGRDASFASRKPGWERYVEADREVRVFRSGGRIKAIQVIAAKGRVIQDSFLRGALKELTGVSEFSVVSSEKRPGYLLKRCRVGQKGDLLVYFEEPSEVIRAFVVSPG